MRLRLVEPMLAKPGRLPAGDRFGFEVKWDGFRCVAAADGVGVRARSRRGWNLSALIPELLAQLPAGVFDGELVAFRDGVPHFPDVCARLLHGDTSIPLTFVVFDLLALPEGSLLASSYLQRRSVLEQLVPEGAHVRLSERFDDGAALFDAVRAHGLEGIVAKRLNGRYRPGERGWLKIKNRDYWRREQELELIARTGWSRRRPGSTPAVESAGPVG